MTSRSSPRHYQIVDKIGEGGMAEVFRALAIEPDGRQSTVVLKRILPHLASDPDYVEMFVDEARIASTLEHPNIVRLLDIGRMQGQIFLALEFVDGADLRRLMLLGEEIAAPLSVASVLLVMRDVLRALDYAHRNRDPDGRLAPVIHRDVSPQNVLVSKSGAVKLLDFGIAKKSGLDSKTAVGMVKGNALYLSPEQATGVPVEPRSDVYQAGLLLLTLVCGKNPFESETLQALLERARRAQIPPPSRYRPDVPPFLDDLVARATRLAPEERLPSAAAFADVIEAIAARERIPLTPESLVRDLDWAFAGGKVTNTFSIPTESKAADAIGPRTEVFLEPIAEPEPRGPGTLLDFLEALAPLAAGAGGEPDGDDEDEEEQEATRTSPAAPQASAFPPPPTVSTVRPPAAADLRPTRVDVVSAAPSPATATLDEATRVSQPMLPPEEGDDEESTQLSPAAGLGEITGTSERTSLEHTVISAQLPPEEESPAVDAGKRAATNANDSELETQPGAGNEEIPESGVSILAHEGPVRALAVAASVARAISGGDDGRIRLWDLAAGRPIVDLEGHEGGVRSVALSINGAIGLSTGRDGNLSVWDLRTSGAVAVLDRGREIRSIALSPEGNLAVGGAGDASVVAWDIARRRVLTTLAGHEGPVNAVALFGDRVRALSASEDGTIRIWSLEGGDELALMQVDEGVNAVALSSDGGIALAGEASGTVSVWSTDAASCVHRLPLHGARVTALCLSADGSVALSGAEDGSVVRFDVRRGVALHRLLVHEGAVTAVALAPDGVHALSAGEDGRIRGW